MEYKHYTVLPNRLKELRQERKLTQKEVAKILDKDFTTICGHETHRLRITEPDILAYCKLFKIESYELFLPRAPLSPDV